jgi:hypothetical protein
MSCKYHALLTLGFVSSQKLMWCCALKSQLKTMKPTQNKGSMRGTTLVQKDLQHIVFVVRLATITLQVRVGYSEHRNWYPELAGYLHKTTWRPL